MDVMVDGLGAVAHAAEDAGAAAGHGSSFADTAAQAHGAGGKDDASAAAGGSSAAKEAAAKPTGGSSWWDDAVGAVKSAAGRVDSAVHTAGDAVDQAAGAAIDKGTDAVRGVAGNTAASMVHGAAEALRDSVKQQAGFSYGFAAGATGAVGGMVEGTGKLVEGAGTLAHDGYRLATDSSYRSEVGHAAVQKGSALLNGAGQLAKHVADDPLGSAKEAARGAKALGKTGVQAGEDWLEGVGRAVQEGNGAEYLGKQLGSATVNVGSFFIPGGGAAEAANVAGHVGEMGNVAGHVGELANAAGHAGELANVVGHAGEVASVAGKGLDAERSLAGTEHALTNATSLQTSAQGQLRGTRYELPGWHDETVSYTKRQSGSLQSLRKEFDSSARKDFLKDLANNHADTLRAAGMNDTQIARVKSGRVPSGYQVHHYLPLDDGGTNATENLVLIKNDPDHMIITNHQNAATKGMTAGDTRVLSWPMPDGPSPKVLPTTPNGGARPTIP